MKAAKIFAAIFLFSLLGAAIAQNRRDYSAIDEYVRKCGPNCGATPEETAQKVTATATCEIEKARAIFDWIAYNISYNLSRQKDMSVYKAQTAFKLRSGVCAHYQDLFTVMGKAVGLDVLEFNGDGSKNSVMYRPREGDTCGVNHGWNAVVLHDEGRVILLDTTWGAGTYNSGFTRRFNPAWFDTPPSVFVFTHYPAAYSQQLVEPCASEEVFLQLPFVSPLLSYLGLNGDSIYKFFLEHPEHNCVLVLEDLFDFVREGVRIEEIPFARYLEKDKEYTFRFSNVPQDYSLRIDSQNYSPDENGNITIKKIFSKTGAATFYNSKNRGLLEYTVVEDIKKIYAPFSKRKAEKDVFPHAVGLTKIKKAMLCSVPDNSKANGRFYIKNQEFSDQNGFVKLYGSMAAAALDLNALSKREGFEEYYKFQDGKIFEDKNAIGYRFPTFEEWTLLAKRAAAAIGTNPKDFYEYAYVSSNSGGNYHYPAQKKPDVNGLYDFFGNARELCVTENGFFAVGGSINSSIEEAVSLDVAMNPKDFFATVRAVLNLPDSIEGLNAEGKILYDGTLVQEDWGRAKTLFEKAAAKDFAESIYYLARIQTYSQSRETPDFKAGLANYQKAAALGDPKAMCSLAILYRYGGDVEQDYNAAFLLMKKSADAGHVFARYQLALYYRDGIGTEKNPQKYFEIISELAKIKFRDSQFLLAECYINGIGVVANAQEGVVIYRRLANEDKNVRAMELAGDCYAQGIGFRKHWGEAEWFYEKAAKAGSAYAKGKIALGILYGWAISYDFEKIEKNFTECIAEYKANDAFINLVKAEYEGFCIAKDALEVLTKNRGEFLKNIPRDTRATDFIFEFVNIYAATEKVFSRPLLEHYPLARFTLSNIKNKVSVPIQKLEKGESLAGYKKVLVVIQGSAASVNKFIPKASAKKLLAPNELRRITYKDFNNTIAKDCDALVFVPAEASEDVLALVKSKLAADSECSFCAFVL